MDSSRYLWSRFEKSGKLTDYLSFCRERERSRSNIADLPEKAEAPDKRPVDQSSL